jgi:hypothetical protein
MSATVKIPTLILTCILIAATAAITGIHRPASAQATEGAIKVDPFPDPADPASKALRERIVMISVLKDGSVVKQREVGVSDLPPSWSLPVGIYDVRVEGDGMVAVTKRGVHVTPNDGTDVRVPMRAGQGVCECKYTK